MLEINQVLQSRYRITRQLGFGERGPVYEAIDERLSQPVILKEIIADDTNLEQKELAVKNFEREARALAKAKSDAVPLMSNYFSEFDRQFFVMEMVRGTNLSEKIERNDKHFALEDVLRWMDSLLEALDYLHNLEPPIIQFNIRPQNLKLNNNRQLKLIDFGIPGRDLRSEILTAQISLVGPLNYSPIEQILPLIDRASPEFIISKYKEKAERVLIRDLDAGCDIYALGATFYHLLTNQVPVEAVKRAYDIWEGKSDPLPNPAELNPEIPASICACLLKAMALERNDRYLSASEMREAIQPAINEIKAITDLQRKKQKISAKQPRSPEHPNQESKLSQIVSDFAVSGCSGADYTGFYREVNISDNILTYKESQHSFPTSSWSSKISPFEKESLYKVFVENKFDLIQNAIVDGIVLDAGSSHISLILDDDRTCFTVSSTGNRPISDDSIENYNAVWTALDNLVSKHQVKNSPHENFQTKPGAGHRFLSKVKIYYQKIKNKFK